MSKLIVGDHVVVDSPAHERHGERGVVVYIGRWTIGVSFYGNQYGFMESELIHAGLAL